MTRTGHVYTPATTLAFEAQCRQACEAVVAEHGDWSTRFESKMLYAVRVVITRTARTGDLDNYFKAVCDGINKVAYPDDRYIAALTSRMTEGERGHVLAHVVRTEMPAALDERRAAVIALELELGKLT